MKHITNIISIALVASLAVSIHVTATDIVCPAPKNKDGLAGAVLILGCAGVATCIIIRVMAHNDQVRVHRLVLQKSPTMDGQNWVNVTTNDFMLTPEEFWPAFAARMGKNAEFYRVIEIPIPPGGNINIQTKTVFITW